MLYNKTMKYVWSNNKIYYVTMSYVNIEIGF